MSPHWNWANFTPRSITSLRGYTAKDLAHDLIAGITVGLVALPLAMAFAIASGVQPQAGLYCAVLAGFLISALGGSKTQIGGPTGAFVVVVSSIVAKHGLDGLFMCTLMAGLILILLGITGLGTAIQFIPRPVVIGFTNGIAILIASTQIKDFFGLQIASVPGEFGPRVQLLAANAGSAQLWPTVIATSCLVLILVMRRFIPKIPGTILAMLGGTIAVYAFSLPLETIETRFGGIPSGFPSFHTPTFRPDLIVSLLSPAITVAMLGAIESLLSAVVADRLSGGRHNPNVELVAQGVANVVSPLAGGLPATGAIARTATNIRSGARTPIAGMTHAIVLLLILLFAAPLAKHIPMAVLAAILMTVAYNMGEWHEITEIWKLSWADISVWMVTFMLTVFADLTVAVEAGMILAALMYIRKVTSTTTVSRITSEDIEAGREHSLQLHDVPKGVAIYRIHGPFLFGSTEKLDRIYRDFDSLPPILILRLRNMTAIDATGIKALEELADRLKASGRTLLLCGARDQPRRLMKQADFQMRIGVVNVQPNVSKALDRARHLLARAESPNPAQTA
jgi:SulP family sulfate permease